MFSNPPKIGTMISLLSLLAWSTASGAQTFDVLIRNARVLDGTGNPWFRADIGIRGDVIAAIGRLTDATARRVIDASGRTVTPGFIDLHSHADNSGLEAEDARRRSAPNLVAQGITTVVVNHDGRSPWPIAEQRAALERGGIGVNTALLIGHGAVRRRVMGDDFRRHATADELHSMRQLVRQGMEDGAYGMSSGLEYVPGRWSDTEELIGLATEIVPYGGVYITHERSSGQDPMWFVPSMNEPISTMLDAVVETIRIAERTGITAVQTHIKARGADYWGSSRAAIQIIERARARGVPIWADQYPYNTTGSDGNTVLVPRWVFEGDSLPENGGGRIRINPVDALRRVLGDPGLTERLRRDIAHEIKRRGDPENIVVMEYPDPTVVGKTIGELARQRGITPVDVAIQLQLEGSRRPGGGVLRGFSLSEIDVELYGAQPWVATATDGWIALPEDGLTHVRVYGTYPRKIAYYAKQRGVLSVPDAVRSSTSLPAQILALEDRGMIREGMKADLVIMNLDELADRATFFAPHQYPDGIDFVFVNGSAVVDEGAFTGGLAGVIITP